MVMVKFLIYCFLVFVLLLSNTIYLFHYSEHESWRQRVETWGPKETPKKEEPEKKKINFSAMITVTTSDGNVLNQELQKVQEELPAQLQTAPSDQSNNYPASNLLEQYTTVAVQEEARRHDRLIVESTAFFLSLTSNDISEMNAVGKMYNASDLCINILTSNRKLHYVDSLLMMLLKGQSLERLFSFAQVNLINTERHPEKVEFPHLKDLARFEFLKIYNASEMYPLEPDISFDVMNRKNTMAALDICAESKLPYCVVFEDDAVTPVDFIDHLEKFVIEPIKKKKIRPALVTLFAHYSHPWTHHQVEAEGYIRSGQYESDRSKMNRERRSKGLGPYTPNFEVIDADLDFGAVANLYTVEMAKSLRAHLASFGMDDTVAPADNLMNREFLKIVGAPKMKVNPSLVNHIGFYSERTNQVTYTHTDVRFVVDAGEYS